MIPAPSRWMIRLSLIWLLISAIAGGFILSHKALDLHPAIWSLLTVHYELAVWGWMVQFVMGTAYWMFPKYITGSRRGPEAPAWTLVILFNTGVILLAASPFISISFAALTGRILIGISILLFATLTWQRIVSYRSLETG